MFAFVSAFPKSLHCTDEAQQAETVLSAVLSITLLLLRAGEISVFPRQRFRAVQWFHGRLRGQMHPTFGSLLPEFVEHSAWECFVAGHWQSSLPR